MGHTTLWSKDLISPFAAIQERYTVVPPEQALQINNNRFKLVFFLEGGLEMQLSDGRTQRLEEGDAISLSLPLTQVYRGLQPSRETRVHVIRIDFVWPCTPHPPGRPTHVPRTSGARFAHALRNRLEGFHHFPRALFGDHHRLLRTILLELEHQTPSAAWKVSGLCLTVLGGLLAASEEPKPRPQPMITRGGGVIPHVCRYLEENIHERLTLTAIAWRVQLSAEHLARLFKQHTGQTVFEYLDNLRVEKAKRLLLTSERSLFQIARGCGFSSVALLNRHFLARTGCLPSRFRMNGRAQETGGPSVLRRIE